MDGSKEYRSEPRNYCSICIIAFLDTFTPGHLLPALGNWTVVENWNGVQRFRIVVGAYIFCPFDSACVVKTFFLASNGSLYVDKPTAGYINDLKRIALKADWKPGTPFIDLTGGSPGAAVILGGRIMGVPWLLGAYKGSSEFAKTAIEMVSKSEQRAAWVLTAPENKKRIPSEILVGLGLDFPKSYEMVGKVKTGYRDEVQLFWKPLGD